jgi:hypothetical protein
VVLVSIVKGWKLFIVEQTSGPPFSTARSELHLPGARLSKAMFIMKIGRDREKWT